MARRPSLDLRARVRAPLIGAVAFALSACPPASCQATVLLGPGNGLVGTAAGQQLGNDCAIGGDWTGDGVRDLVIASLSVAVTIHDGATGAIWMTIAAPPGSGSFGQTVAAGDLTGDDIDDLAIGTGDPPGFDGAVYFVDGATIVAATPPGPGWQPVLSAYTTGQQYGRMVHVADLDGNGVAEVLVAANDFAYAYGYSNGAFVTLTPAMPSLAGQCVSVGSYPITGGQRHILMGDLASGADGFVQVYTNGGTHIQQIAGPQTNDYFGNNFEACGDLDGDGAPDFAVTSPSESGGGSVRGAVYFFSGATFAPLSGSPVNGLYDGDYLGRVANIGDIDGDGVADVAVSTALAQVGGYVHLVSGATRAQIGQTVADPTPGNNRFGADIAAADLSGDGCVELLVTSTFYSAPGIPNAGGAYVLTGLLGCTPPPPPPPVFTLAITPTNVLGPGALTVALTNGGANQPYFTALTLNFANYTTCGTGWWFGIDISYTELFGETMLPQPFRGTLSPQGTATWTLPPGTLPPFIYGFKVFGVSISFDAVTGFLALVSPPVCC